ncbi:Diaminopimelate epimerase [Gossypium arboreum]|uniref:Diaminopimelate epimerase n=1 Tax=Gossypium arboreum TaxID=29729 RepID=A0A0B0NRW2_GOSAR|nr:Diaminopimelate epimerase [Gossypium arboreum]
MGQKQRKLANVQNQHGLHLLTRADHTVVSIWQNRSTTHTGGPHARMFLLSPSLVQFGKGQL